MIEKKVASPRKQRIWRVKKGFTLVEMRYIKFTDLVQTSSESLACLDKLIFY